MKSTLVGMGVAALALAAITHAENSFPLTVQNMTVEEVQACPGGYGGYAQFSTRVPDEVKKAPTFRSKYPLYAVMQRNDPQPGGSPSAGAAVAFALDESRGTGKGYDRLIADLNANGDLTDDPASERSEGSAPGGSRTEFARFGPLELSANLAAGPWRPRVFAEAFLYNKRMLKTRRVDASMPIGQLRIQAGNYLAANVEVNGVKQKIGLIDGDCNFRLLEPARLVKVQRMANDAGSWYLDAADHYLRDRDGDGKFTRTMAGDEAEDCGPWLYFGTKPYVPTVSTDLKTIQFEPYGGAVGELRVPKELSHLVLAREAAADRWEPVAPTVENGIAVLPEGAYRMASCALASDMKLPNWMRMSSSEVGAGTFRVAAGQATAFAHGLPLRLEVTANREQAQRGIVDPDAGWWTRFTGWLASFGSPEDVLRLNVNVLGSGKERYAGFVSPQGQVQPPTFRIADATGTAVGTGTFEFG